MTAMTPLREILDSFRQVAQTPRDLGTLFEGLIKLYLRNEAAHKDRYSQVWTYAEWAKEHGEQWGRNRKDTGIDLVAETAGTTKEYHAIQCKFYAEGHRIQRRDIDSFFTASGQKPFCHGLIVTTTNNWTGNARDALDDRQPPVSKIDLDALEESQIDWSKYWSDKPIVLKPQYELRPHQRRAHRDVTEGLKRLDRGKLIMACGTGKTLTSLKIAETMAGPGARVLFLVPGLSLLSQTLSEWTQQSKTPLHSFAVCSDAQTGKKREQDADMIQPPVYELRYPATTNARSLATEMSQRHDAQHMSVVFSTYHSIEVINKAQQEFKLADFDLIICDEAHRTTGATFGGDDKESNFVRVHNNTFIRARKRLYMTATPRIYGNAAKATAEKQNITLYSMDDKDGDAHFGKELHVISFSEAVERGLLVDYKVIVLAVDEAHISTRLQTLLADENNALRIDDAAKIIGCWKALAKHQEAEENQPVDARDRDRNHDHDHDLDRDPMRRAVAFCQVIDPPTGTKPQKTHKVSSKNIADMFQEVVETYQQQEPDHNTLVCEANHVDGRMNAAEKQEKLDWLKADTPDDTCRILSNVRCLSEGVDVPALDAVLFLTPRNSQIDVVQSVGRIMRTAPGKKLGYVILPVAIPADVLPHEALDDNKTYKVVWEVLQALRSHDDRFDAHINKLEFSGGDKKKMEVITITDEVKQPATPAKAAGKGTHTLGASAPTLSSGAGQSAFQHQMHFEVGEIERALYAKVVQKCGNRYYWHEWAADIADIARTHITRITTIVTNPDNTAEAAAFQAFGRELRDDLNDSLSDDEVIEMLAQHLITKPVFDALFGESNFARHNPVSRAMQNILAVLNPHHLDKEARTLDQFYANVKMRAEGIDNAAAKQKIVVQLYDDFFRTAFPRMTERLGIVYTPVPVVDFIIHSVNDVLKSRFGQTLGSPGVHIIDPFTGTGTFVTRMLQSNLISPDQLAHKYNNEIHANEIVLLAYYIAAINIEAVYHDLINGEYAPFPGICLTDTFQLSEKDDLVSQLLVDNSTRRTRQKQLDIRVIIGNPPYSSGQSSANDNATNVAYPGLDSRIGETYAARSKTTLQRNLYDSYIRAIRWASDRIGDCGVIGFVTNAGWIDAAAMDGFRQCLAEEFTTLYVFHLRGNQRTSGELSKKEGGKIFGSGSRAPIAITILVKDPDKAECGRIHFHDIGDYLSREQKLETISTMESIDGITAAHGWQTITPDAHGDWLDQRDNSFDAFIPLGDKKKGTTPMLFDNFSLGIATNRDAWAYNASRIALGENMRRMIDFYNNELERFNEAHEGENPKARAEKVNNFIDNDAGRISWTRALKADLAKNRRFDFDETCMVPSQYRPFTRQWLYYSRTFNEMVLQIPRIFPTGHEENRVIAVSGVGARSGFSVYMVDTLPCLDMVEKGQCFPLYLYDAAEGPGNDSPPSLLTSSGPARRDAVTDEGLQHFMNAYPGEAISKADLFYYVYGLLHSEDYRTRYANNLSKQLPRIPCVRTAQDFRAFAAAGRALGDLHVNYEHATPHPVTIVGNPMADADYYVTKMKFAKNGKEKDPTTVIYNPHITIKNIPAEAWDYTVNGKPALAWVMDRQCLKTDKASGIQNDANAYATETMNNPKYPLTLFQKIITLSLKTQKITKSLPKLDIMAPAGEGTEE